MVIKISCKYIKDNAFDITVGQETTQLPTKTIRLFLS